MGSTSIEWTDATWNPTTGCNKVSPGCTHCYALTMAKRLKAMGSPKYQRDGPPLTSGPGFGVTLHPEALEEPMHWREPRMVFVNSMSDLFHPAVPFKFIDQVLAVMARTPEHTYQILTKRPERMLAFYSHWNPQDLAPYPLPNVWLGVSVESQRWTSRLEVLARIPAAVRFVSCEPLLRPLNLKPYFYKCSGCGEVPCRCKGLALGWVIIGGESGPGARPMNLEWVRGIVRQCRESGVPCFVKQLGRHPMTACSPCAGPGRPPGILPCVVCEGTGLVPLRLHARKGGEPSEWPEDLRVREWPRKEVRS